ncbi:Mur ligase family protein [Rhizobium sp.]
MSNRSNFAWLEAQSVLVDGISDDARGLIDFLAKRAGKLGVLVADRNQQDPARIASLLAAAVQIVDRQGDDRPEFGDARTLFVDLFTSPRSALVDQAKERNIKLSSLAEVIVKSLPARAIGVTGSAGKTTTTFLISAMLRAAGLSARASTDDRFTPSGPGHAMLSSLPDLSDDTWRVVELTSHHLEYVGTSPHIAVVTNLFADHQDWHGSFDAYREAKKRLLAFQTADDVAVLNYDDDIVRTDFAAATKGRTVFYSMSDVPAADVFVQDGAIMGRFPGGLSKICAVSELSMPGHHVPNALAAAAAAIVAGANLDGIARALRTFGGLPQRGQIVGRIGAVAIHDDTIALNPKKALSGLEAFPFDNVVVVSGGAVVSPGGEQRVSSELERADLARYCQELGRKAKAVVLYGDGGEIISSGLQGDDYPGLTVERASDFTEALARAVSLAWQDGRVLVAPVFYNRPADLKQVIDEAIQASRPEGSSADSESTDTK